jgi:hypothetical protein
MDNLGNLINFLNKLENNKIFFHLSKIRDSILVEVSVPGQRWEIEYFADGTIVVEKFISNGEIFNAEELEKLFDQFSDGL